MVWQIYWTSACAYAQGHARNEARLRQARNLRVEVGEGAFDLLAMAGVRGAVQVVGHTLAGEFQAEPLLILSRDHANGLARLLPQFLLGLDVFALPSPGHEDFMVSNSRRRIN